MTERGFELWRDYLKEHWGSRARSFDKFDHAVLTLASGALGLSLAFLKDLVPARDAIFLPGLVVSWVCFSVAILTILVSFYVGPFEIDCQLVNAEKYYVDGKKSFLNKPNRLTAVIKWLNGVSGASTVLGLVLTVLFVSFNILSAAGR